MAMGLGSKKPVTDINVTPLIDVVLVLLIIFMVLTPLAEKQKFLRVPEYQPEVQPVPPDQAPPDQTVLTVLKNGRVLLNKQELEVPEAMKRGCAPSWATTLATPPSSTPCTAWATASKRPRPRKLKARPWPSEASEPGSPSHSRSSPSSRR